MVSELNPIIIFRDFLKDRQTDLDATEIKNLITIFEEMSTGDPDDIENTINSFLEGVG